MFRRALSQHICKPGLRMLHQVPDLGFTKGAGLPGLFSGRGLDIAWFEYQHYLTTEINKSLENVTLPTECKTMEDLARVFSKETQPELRKIAALASQAYTNEFFFRTLRKDGSVNPDASFVKKTDAVDISKKVLNMPPHPPTETALDQYSYARGTQEPAYPAYNKLRNTFGDIGTFRETLIIRGEAQFGNGSIWLVTNKSAVALINAYGWGTPISHTKDQAAHSITSTNTKVDAVPVLSINMWEHVYLHDYGVDGKRQFLENAFDCIDWGVIDSRLEPTY